MTIVQCASAGAYKNSDILVEVAPLDHVGVVIELESDMMRQFGRQIEASIAKVASDLGVTAVQIRAKDAGALDFTIRARTETALRRGAVGKEQS